VSVPLASGGYLVVEFRERDIEFRLTGRGRHTHLALIFEWVRDCSAFQGVTANVLSYHFHDFEYAVHIENGTTSQTADGVTVLGKRDSALRLKMAQLPKPS